MSSRILIPFDYNPVASSIKTGNYTIPQGRYARLVVDCKQTKYGNTLTFTASAGNVTSTLTDQQVSLVLNGVAIYPMPFSVTVAVSTTTQTTPRTMTLNLPAGSYFKRETFANYTLTSSAGSGAVGGFLYTAEGTIATGLGDSYQSGTITGFAHQQVKTFASGTQAGNNNFLVWNGDLESISKWVKSGDVIECPPNGTYWLEEYNVIS